ncbi:hypothetical protein CRG98_033752 [Punica granatum]|uniref:Metallo-beta-lactamase domain-containing protein n=1 Tax=Punica granatum TaxID=22663 RepID=A0A2I0IPC3_PUNGR|nr:hypothetical protein CRG98_033752 [Punica granatum]
MTDDWNSAYTFVSGSEDICVGGQRLSIIFAPGHTDGHLALLHNSTRSLIVGDHCVGQGSAFLDLYSGASMADYFKTTYKFMELSPHALIPMHGRCFSIERFNRSLGSFAAELDKFEAKSSL